jgi:hypothetical protein
MEDEHQRLAPWSFSLCPGFEPLDLAVEIRPLIVFTHACIECQETLICLAEQALDFGSRNACFDTHPNRLDLTHFHSTSDRDGMQAQFLSQPSLPGDTFEHLLSCSIEHNIQILSQQLLFTPH